MISENMRVRGNHLCKVMREVAGVDPLEKTRRHDVAMARMMVAQQLYDDGYIDRQIGELLGKNRATIHFYRTKMASIALPGWGAEQDLWRRFTKAI